MSRGSLDDLGELQKTVMEIVWTLGEASVNQVRAKLGRRKLAYTTVLSVMQKLDKAGWLTHREEGRVCLSAGDEPRRSGAQLVAAVYQTRLRR